ncbi:MAG: hypothetical protein KKA42_06395 [candidate division Zixibacteria bacterium]|nr:hypothetical protein [candidate division Zixibacteria bacterium]
MWPRTISAGVVLLFVCFSFAAAEVDIPPDNFVEGWQKSEDLLRFVGHDLYGHIDGGAELFHEFGFEQLLVQRYAQGDNEIDLEIYQMTEPTAALGIYLMKCGTEKPLPGLEMRNSGGASQILLLKDRFFIQLNNFLGDSTLIPAMTTLARQVTAGLPDRQPLVVMDGLPPEGLMSGSARIIRGPYGLQPIYTFGKGDILQLDGRIFGAVGDYETEAGETWTTIVIPYPSPKNARAAFANLTANLDDYLTVTDRNDSAFTFQDYRSKFGLVRVRDGVLDIRIDLAAQPALP